MKTDINGRSTVKPGKESFEYYNVRKKRFCQYDFRRIDGVLFTIIKPTLEECRKAKDEYFKKEDQDGI